MASLSAPLTSVYYTDGSATPDGAAGAAAVCAAGTLSWRLSPGASAYQAELVGILGALRHAATQNTDVVVHTDSLSALTALCSQVTSDNTNILTELFHTAASIVAQDRRVTLNWVPAHAGIVGNEQADQAARQAALTDEVTIPVTPSLATVRARARAAAQRLSRLEHRAAVEEGRASASWYASATRYEALDLPTSTTSGARVALSRLRMGYPCVNTMLGREPDPCAHCLEVSEMPLIHYLLYCPATWRLRQSLVAPPPHFDEAEAATAVISSSPLQLLLNTVLQYPPPK